MFESEPESWSSDPKAPKSWIYSMNHPFADPYFSDKEQKSFRCEVMPRVKMGLDDVKDKFGNWVDEKYREGKPKDYFKDLFEIAADYGFEH